MPNFRAVVGCGNKSSNVKDVGYFRFPSTNNNKDVLVQAVVEKREKWVAAQRENITESMLKNSRVCSRHCLTGIYSYTNSLHLKIVGEFETCQGVILGNFSYDICCEPCYTAVTVVQRNYIHLIFINKSR